LGEKRRPARTYLDRIIVIRPTRGDGERSYLEGLFQQACRPIPDMLAVWESQVDAWCVEYQASTGATDILEVNLETAVYLFDRVAERVVGAYGISVEQQRRRDTSRMRGFPNVNIGVRAVLGGRAFLADRGHLLGHASGGVMDINLFPQRRELNRGWSPEGRQFREMERFVSAHLGVFFYHRPLYDDDTWIPCQLEYGVLVDDLQWWIKRFRNK